jgi:sugar phosphate isomerase/epimerase
MAQSKLTRRGFIGAAAASGIGVATASTFGPLAGTANAAMGVAGPDTPSSAIGLQLYSVRNLVSSLGFRAVFEELARLGFKEVEFAGYTQSTSILGRQITPEEILQLLKDNGLKAIGSHIGLNNLLNVGQREREFETAKILEMPYIGTASDFPGQTVDEIKAGAARFNDAGAAAAAMGLKIYQHNHSNEFSFTTDDQTKRRHDVFLEATDPSLVFLEMDILWAFGGARKFAVPGGTNGVPKADGSLGFDPADYVVRNPQRYPLFHVKDGTANANPASGNSYSDVEFGAGVIPFRDFFDTIGARSEHHPLWEQDSAPNTPASRGGAFGAAERSITNMRFVRTLSWLDELGDMLDTYLEAGRISDKVHVSLHDRLSRALKLAEEGSESRTAAYVEQFIARANNQIKGNQDQLARALLVQAAEAVLAWLADADDRENAL